MLNALATIILLLAGCDEPSAPAADIAVTSAVVEAPCDFTAQTKAGTIYFYAEAPLDGPTPQVYTCTKPGLAVLPTRCEPTNEYGIENGVARVLCGTFTQERLSKADFVRVEMASKAP